MLATVVVSVAKVASVVSVIAVPRLLAVIDGLMLQDELGLVGATTSGLAAVVVPVLFAGALLAKAQRMATSDVVTHRH